MTLKPSRRSKQGKKPAFFYDLRPWECRHHKDYSEIVAYVEASGKLEVILTILPTAGARAEDLAAFIVRLVNGAQKSQDLLRSAMDALELCLQEADLTFATEQAADSVVLRLKRAGL